MAVKFEIISLYRRLKVSYDSSSMPIKGTYKGEVGIPESPSLHSSHVIMVGVPAEIAVAISLASFLIGAALTGMLCCIHHRRTMSKTVVVRRYFNLPF